MPGVQIQRVNNRQPLPYLLAEHVVGPAAGNNATSKFLGQVPTTGGPLQLARVLLVPSANIAEGLAGTVLSVQSLDGVTTYASVTNAAAITAAAGVALTLGTGAASIPAGTLLRMHAQNVADGTALNAITLNFQAEFQPA